jgi:hypothetical protein
MKFIADMGISPKTVGFLRDLGNQAAHLHEEGPDRLMENLPITLYFLPRRLVFKYTYLKNKPESS